MSVDDADWADLLARMGDRPPESPKPKPVEPPPPAQVMTVEPFLHYCACGKWGSWGYQYDYRRTGNAGIWYCLEHRPPQLVARHSQT